MPDTLVLVHTVPPLLGVFGRLAQELLPGVRVLHILDEPLLERVRQRGRLAPEDADRLLQHAQEAAQIGARAVLVTCSTISPCVDEMRARSPLPIQKIDEAMIARAVESGRRIGVVATAPTTLEPTRQALQARAASEARAVEVELQLVEGAMAALMAGDGAEHDRRVKAAVLELARRADVVVLAQASMARVLDALPEAERPVPVLASPQLALAQMRGLFGN